MKNTEESRSWTCVVLLLCAVGCSGSGSAGGGAATGGITRRDTTYEAIARLLDKEITGFGELFRMLSFADIGAAAMLSRATAGVAGERVLFALPGSTAAVELAMTKLILPQLQHIAGLLKV